MSIEMKITGANPAEIAAHITGLYGMLHIGKAMAAAPVVAEPVQMADAPVAEVKAEGDSGLTPVHQPVEQPVEPPKRGRPKKTAEPAPTIEAKAEPQPEPEKQIDIEEAIAEVKPEPAKPVDEAMIRSAVIKLGNAGKVKAAPEVQEAMRKAVGAAFVELDDAGKSRGLPALPEHKVSMVPAARYAEFLALLERRTAEIDALPAGGWKGV